MSEEQKEVKEEAKADVEAIVSQELKDELKEKAESTNIEELLARNEFAFEFNGQSYRVRQPSFKEKQEAYKKQGLKFTELLDSDEYKLDAVLREIYKKKGIDISDIERRMQDIIAKKTDYQLKLGKMLKEGGKDSDLKSYRKEIEALQEEVYELSIKKSQLLQYSIENQTILYVYQYMTWNVLEIQNEKEEWVRAFSTLDDFLSSDEELINTASFNASLIIGKL